MERGHPRTRKGYLHRRSATWELRDLCDRSRLSALNWSGMKTTVAVPVGANCADATIRLGPKAAKLRVTVINGMTQEPIKGAEVWLTGDFEDQLPGWSLRVSGDLAPVPAVKIPDYRQRWSRGFRRVTAFDNLAHAGRPNPGDPDRAYALIFAIDWDPFSHRSWITAYTEVIPKTNGVMSGLATRTKPLARAGPTQLSDSPVILPC